MLRLLGDYSFGLQGAVTLSYDDTFLQPRYAFYLIDARVRAGAKDYAARHEMNPRFFGESFEYGVQNVLQAIADEVLVKPATQKLMDEYTDAVHSGRFRPPV